MARTESGQNGLFQQTVRELSVPSDEGKPDDISRNFVGVGLGSILAGVIGAFAVDASPPSTALVKESGGRSQFASLTAGALMVALSPDRSARSGTHPRVLVRWRH